VNINIFIKRILEIPSETFLNLQFLLFLRGFENAQILAYKNVNCGDSSLKKSLDIKNYIYL